MTQALSMVVPSLAETRSQQEITGTRLTRVCSVALSKLMGRRGVGGGQPSESGRRLWSHCEGLQPLLSTLDEAVLLGSPQVWRAVLPPLGPFLSPFQPPDRGQQGGRTQPVLGRHLMNSGFKPWEREKLVGPCPIHGLVMSSTNPKGLKITVLIYATSLGVRT